MAIEVVFEKQINNATVYRDVDVAQRRQNYIWTGVALLLGVGLLFYGWQQYRWLQLGYDIELLEKQKGELLEYQKKLIVEFEYHSRDDRIDAIARNRLGMVDPAPWQIVLFAPEEPALSPEDAAAPLSAANLSVRPAVHRVPKDTDQCPEDDSKTPTSGGGPAERCQEAR